MICIYRPFEALSISISRGDGGSQQVPLKDKIRPPFGLLTCEPRPQTFYGKPGWPSVGTEWLIKIGV